MRKILFILLLAPLLFLTSCSKDDCVDEVLGTYIGTESCQGQVFSLTFVLGSSTQEDNIVLSVSGSSLTFNGELDSDCSRIVIPSQTVTANGLALTVDGSLNVNTDNLTGTLTYSSGAICTYNLNRQ